MNKHDVIEFFDKYAPSWDTNQVSKDKIINRILDNAGIAEGQEILDVACGTGVLFPFYLERQAAQVTGIDISPEMARIAAGKYPNCDCIRVICGDAEEASFDRQFDCVMVYNAFPHFPDPDRLIANLASFTREGGRLTIAHSASRDEIDHHHSGAASKVSHGLMSAEELKELLEPWFHVDVLISTQEMYQVSGVRRAEHVHHHTHSHGAVHHHHHGHSHSHGHDHHHHDVPAADATPMDEIVALMKFMVSHNEAHAQELAELAQTLGDAGNRTAYRRIMDAVVNFDMGNATLSAVLEDLAAEL